MSKTTVRKGKQDDKFSLAIREVQGWAPENKKCFDCEQRGPTYINITVGSFVCTKCSGMLRGMNPPHRIKSISMSTFTPDEVEFMRTRGNAWCSKIWLARWDPVNQPVDFKDDEKVKDFMIAKYEKKRYYNEAAEKIVGARSSPSISSLSSNSSQDNKPLASLIGSTIKSHMGHNQSTHNSSSVIPRSVHAAVPRPLDKLSQLPGRPAQPPVGPPTFPQQSTAASTLAASLTAPAASTAIVANTAQQPPSQQTDGFADFANFETAAFDSLPSDPLSGPPVFPPDTLPPLKKLSQGSLVTPATITAPPSNNNKQQPQAEVGQKQDRYSALKELDDLFKTATIQSPAAPEPAPELAPTGSLFGSSVDPSLTAASIFGSSQQLGGGGSNKQQNGFFSDVTSDSVGLGCAPGVGTPNAFGRSSPASWATTSVGSPAAAPWNSAASVGPSWNRATSPAPVGNNGWAGTNNVGAPPATNSADAGLWGAGNNSAANTDTLWANNSTTGTGQQDALWANSSNKATGQQDTLWASSLASGTGQQDTLWANSSATGTGQQDTLWSSSSGTGQQDTMWTNGSTPKNQQGATSWGWNQGGSTPAAPHQQTQDIWGSAPSATLSAASTNPFGTSPSGPVTSSAVDFSENNNDLFAAAPKPFNDKSGNPWSSVPVFTQNMTPAPNPNNPFL